MDRYLEYCDRGSLSDMMKQYSKHPGEMIPEPFIWHAFIGLADGLAYMQTGGEVSSLFLCQRLEENAYMLLS